MLTVNKRLYKDYYNKNRANYSNFKKIQTKRWFESWVEYLVHNKKSFFYKLRYNWIEVKK